MRVFFSSALVSLREVCQGQQCAIAMLADTLDGGLVVVRVLVLGLGPLDLFLPSLPARRSRRLAGRNPLLTDQRSGYTV